MRNPLIIASLLVLLTCQQLLPVVSHAEMSMPNRATEWRGVKRVLSVMGRGKLTAGDQRSIQDILETKSQVEEGKGTVPVAYPATPVLPSVAKKQPPHRTPSSF